MMQNAFPPLLEYASPQLSVRQLTLLEEPGRVRVAFPALPKWWKLGPMLFALLSIVFAMIVPIAFFIQMSRNIARLRALGVPVTPLPWAVLPSFVGIGTMGLIEVLVILWQFRIQRRHGEVSRVLTVDPMQMTLNYLGPWGLRERRWPADIVTVELNSVKDVFTWKPQYRLVVRRAGKRWPMLFALRTKDSALPRRIFDAIQDVLAHRELQQVAPSLRNCSEITSRLENAPPDSKQILS